MKKYFITAFLGLFTFIRPGMAQAPLDFGDAPELEPAGGGML